MRRPKVTRAPHSRDRLAFESLESRELLAADSATGWSMDWEVPTFEAASWTAGDFWTGGDAWGFDDPWTFDESLTYDDSWAFDGSWTDGDAWGQDDTWVQDVFGDPTAIDTGAVDVGATGYDADVEVVDGTADTTVPTTIEVVAPPERDLPVAPPVVPIQPEVVDVDPPVVPFLPPVDDITVPPQDVPFLPPVDVELPAGVTDEAEVIVVTSSDGIVSEEVFDESIVSAGDGRDDGEIVVVPWLPPAVDSGSDEVTAEGGGEPDVAGGIEVEIGGGTTDESWVVGDTVVDATDLDTAVVVVPPVVPKADVAVPRVAVQAAATAPATPRAGGFRAWGAFFVPGLGAAPGLADAAASGLQTPGQPGTGRPRLRLPFRPVV